MISDLSLCDVFMIITCLVGDPPLNDSIASVIRPEARMKLLVEEWTEDLEKLRSVLRFAQSAPSEMRRHHSFVCECARLIDRSVIDMSWVLKEGGSIATNANSMLEVATRTNGVLDKLLEAARDDLGVSRLVVRDCVRECKQVVSFAFAIRNAMRSVCVKYARLQLQLREHAALIRAGAQAIHDNMSADEAEEHVRKLHVDVPYEWMLPWHPREWLA